MDFRGTKVAFRGLTGVATHRKLTRGQFVDNQERISLASNLRPSPGVVARDMGGSAVLVHLESNRIFELNATGARVWSLFNKACTETRFAIGFNRSSRCRPRTSP